jgi:hypothetical protein
MDGFFRQLFRRVRFKRLGKQQICSNIHFLKITRALHVHDYYSERDTTLPLPALIGRCWASTSIGLGPSVGSGPSMFCFLYVRKLAPVCNLPAKFWEWYETFLAIRWMRMKGCHSFEGTTKEPTKVANVLGAMLCILG